LCGGIAVATPTAMPCGPLLVNFAAAMASASQVGANTVFTIDPDKPAADFCCWPNLAVRPDACRKAVDGVQAD
jgi:hypothetical protein